MTQNNLTTLKPLGIPIVSGGPLSRPKNHQNGRSQEVSESTVTHFKNVLKYIELQKLNEREVLAVGFDSGFQNGGGRWGSIVLPQI
jgi:hypothetical protein